MTDALSQKHALLYDRLTGAVHTQISERSDLIALRIERGESLIEIPEPIHLFGFLWRVDLVTKELVQEVLTGPSIEERLRERIIYDLSRSDRYFLLDADDDLDEHQRGLWRTYRSNLRRAVKLTVAADMLALIGPDPTGVDYYADLRII